MFTQRIYKTGNSLAVTIPKQLLNELNLDEGTEVVVEKNERGVIILPKKQVFAEDVDPKFMKMVDEFIKDHEDVLKELSQK